MYKSSSLVTFPLLILTGVAKAVLEWVMRLPTNASATFRLTFEGLQQEHQQLFQFPPLHLGSP